MYSKFIKKFIIIVLILLLAAAGMVLIFDPFFHYHKPIYPLKAVLTKRNINVLDHFEILSMTA